MSQSDELEFLLPRLRRFARASTADRYIADECVERALQKILEQSQHNLDGEAPSGQVLFYRAVERELEQQAGGSFIKQAWRALILVFVEELSELDTVRILGISVEDVRTMIASAQIKVQEEINR